MKARLDRYSSVPFKVDGPIWSAQTILGPEQYGTKWHIKRMITTCAVTNTTVSTVNLRVYRDVEMPRALVDSTYSALTDISETDIEVLPGEHLLFCWECTLDPGANSIATIRLAGEIVGEV